MKDIRPALRSLLLLDPIVFALVGTPARIYPNQLPQGQRLPSVVFRRITEFGDYHLQGDSGLQQTGVQVDAYAPSADDAVRLADAVHDAISGFRGPVTDANSPPVTVEIRSVQQTNGRDLFDDATALNRMSRDFFIWFAER